MIQEHIEESFMYSIYTRNTALLYVSHLFLRGSEFSSYEIELCKMMSHFELLTRKLLQKFFFQVTNSTS